jgi:2-dehydro-3-deoxyphosphogluconate aldolase / (4S)-4-hydroxy-2-oxoglutarate aldolase
MSHEWIRDRLIAEGVVPVLRFPDSELAVRAIECLIDVGFGAIEVTMTTPDALDVIRAFAERALVGAGTVLDLETAGKCMQAGARFIVSPVVVPGLARLVHATGHAVLVGGFSPAEVCAAHKEGADIVKVFPASTGGPSHIAALHSVFPEIMLCPTGGVSAANMQQYFSAGATIVGVGNAIVPMQALKEGDLEAVRAHAAAYRGSGTA